MPVLGRYQALRQIKELAMENEPKTTIDLPFSPEDVRLGRHLGNAIAGYRDGDFKRSAEGMVEAVRAFQAAAAELDRLRAENAEMKELLGMALVATASGTIFQRRIRAILAKTAKDDSTP